MTFVHRRLILTGMSAALCMAPSIPAQSASAFQAEALDQGIVAPTPTGVLGKVDPEALAEVTAHLTAVSAAPWTGMQGTGQIVYGTGDQTAYSATLSLMGGDRFRLDAQTATGPMSIRIQGRTGQVQGGDGRMFPLPSDTATLGLVQFELPRMANFPNSAASLFAKDAATIDGATFHRVAYEFSPAGKNSGKTVATDLYFDPGTHLLVKSVTSILLEGTRNNRLLQVVTYGDYRRVGSSLVPFRYTQTLDGQPQWTLQLTAVQPNPALDGTFFQF